MNAGSRIMRTDETGWVGEGRENMTMKRERIMMSGGGGGEAFGTDLLRVTPFCGSFVLVGLFHLLQHASFGSCF